MTPKMEMMDKNAKSKILSQGEDLSEVKQSANHLLMVRPAHFGYNAETAVSNAFQHQTALSQNEVQQKAVTEFDAFVAQLRANKIAVTVIEDTVFPVKPDAVFPNNWISLHDNGTVVLYPMNTPNRQAERRQEVIKQLSETFSVKRVIDLSGNEQQQRFLEGTGSIVFDHENKVAYACVSPRTSKELLNELCGQIGYAPFAFRAVDENGKEIYHTNVMMNVARSFAVICLESMSDKMEQEKLIEALQKTKHELINISFSQMANFAGNMLAVENADGKLFLICSQSAFDSLSETQKNSISRYAEFLPVSIPTIETIGGGSARCMVAEVFLPHK